MVKIVETPVLPNDGEEPIEISGGDYELPMAALPPTEESLVVAWRRFVSTQRRGSFQTVLKKWVTARLKMNCAVNAGPEDGALPRAQTPNEEFTNTLRTAFEEVRSKQRKR